MGDLDHERGGGVGTLVTAITTECTPERTEEFFAQPEVEAFLNSSG